MHYFLKLFHQGSLAFRGEVKCFTALCAKVLSRVSALKQVSCMHAIRIAMNTGDTLILEKRWKLADIPMVIVFLVMGDFPPLVNENADRRQGGND